eukprot:3716997-Pyramimonas_sp.AAC.2
MDSWLLYNLSKESGGGESDGFVDKAIIKWKSRKPGQGRGFFLSTTLANMPKWAFTSGISTAISKPKFSIPGLIQQAAEHPSRFHLLAVQEFFRYTEYQGAQPGSSIGCVACVDRGSPNY